MGFLGRLHEAVLGRALEVGRGKRKPGPDKQTLLADAFEQ